MNSLPSEDTYHCPITFESMAYDAMSLFPCGHHIGEPGVQSIIEKKGFFYDLGNLAKLLEENRVDCPLCRERITNIFEAREYRQILQHIDQIAERAGTITEVKEDPESEAVLDDRESKHITSAMLHKSIETQILKEFEALNTSLKEFINYCRSIRINYYRPEESMVPVPLKEHYQSIKNQLCHFDKRKMEIIDELKQLKVSIIIPIDFYVNTEIAKKEVHRAYDAYNNGKGWITETCWNAYGLSDDEVTSFFVR
jgi:hypothetical protein